MSDEETEDIDLSGEIHALSASLCNLMELDPLLLNKTRQGKLSRMKRQIFDALTYYCDCLPQLEEKNNNEET